MGLFSALNARVLAALDKRSGAERLAGASLVGDRLVLTYAGGLVQEAAWSGLRRVVALQRDLYVGSEVSLLIEFDGPWVVEVAASCPGWLDLCAAVEQLEGARPFGEWHAQALSARAGQAIEVWAAAD